jgi:hypothetical protein
MSRPIVSSIGRLFCRYVVFDNHTRSAAVPEIDDHVSFWKTITEYDSSDVPNLIEAERQTRNARVERAFVDGANTDFTGTDQQLFNRMWIGDDLTQVNDALRVDFSNDLASIQAHVEDLTHPPVHGLYSLTRNTRLISFYYRFSSKSAICPGRLDAETERLLIELLWRRTMEKNDIAVSNKSTWWIAGSENHDLNTKVTNLLTSAIFAEVPEYLSRAYPNLGHGCASGYMSAGYHPGAEENPEFRGRERANWSDGKQYTAKDHVASWITFFKEYFAERARKGFFLENGAPGYMKYTVSYILLLYNFCPDPDLKRQVKMFLDLFWTDWALQQIGGLRGGPKTRHHSTAGEYDSMSEWARFYLGGAGTASFNYSQQLIGDYEWDRFIWELVIDRSGLGSFTYISRGIGEEEETCPRPFGVERTMTGECESRMVKYSWITPNYVLGTQMDHPCAIHNHLSIHGRWQGMITSDVNSRIVTVSLEPFAGKTKPENDFCMELAYHSVQHKQVLITQQKRRWMQINPDWFPSYPQIYEVDFGVFIGTGWRTRVEHDGWVFLEQDDTYAAIRVLRVKADPDPLAFAKGTDRYATTVELHDENYTWNDRRTVLRLINKFSPIIIEAGCRADYATMADFQRQILTNKLEIHKTVATHETKIIVVYKGARAEEIVFNAANPFDVPTIGGRYIDYSHPKTFDSPYLNGDYDSGIIAVKKDQSRLTMNFNDIVGEGD